MNSAIILPSEPLAHYVKKGEVKERYFNPGGVFRRIYLLQEQRGWPAGFFGDAEVIEIVGPWAHLDATNVARRCEDAQIVRAYGFDHAAAAGTKLAAAMGLPCVVSAHIPPLTYAALDFRHSGLFRKPLVAPRLLRWRSTFRAADGVLCVTRFVAREVERLAPHTRVEINYNRVDPSFVREPRRGRRERIRLLTIGRLYPTKEHRMLIECLALVAEADLILVGSGPLDRELRELAKRLGVADRIEWIPAVPYRDLPSLHERADIYVMASEGEGFATVILEAMAAGLPVIASRREPFIEVTRGAAALVDHAPGAFAAAIDELRDEERYRTASAAGVRRAIELIDEWPERREADLLRSFMMVGPTWRTDARATIRRRFGPVLGSGLRKRLPVIEADAVDGAEAALWLTLLTDQGALRPGDRILDLGSGLGAFVKRARDAGHSVVALEPDDEDRRITKSRLGGDASRIVGGVAEALPFRTGTFDVITLLNVLEHVSDTGTTLRECARVIRPGGHVFIVAPNYKFRFSEPHYATRWLPLLPWTLHRRYLRARGRDLTLFDSLHFVSRESVLKDAARAGLRPQVLTREDKWETPERIERLWVRGVVRIAGALRLVGLARLTQSALPSQAVRLLLQK